METLFVIYKNCINLNKKTKKIVIKSNSSNIKIFQTLNKHYFSNVQCLMSFEFLFSFNFVFISFSLNEPCLNIYILLFNSMLNKH